MKKHITLFVMLCMTICAWATNYKTISNIAYHTDGNDYAKERCIKAICNGEELKR